MRSFTRLAAALLLASTAPALAAEITVTDFTDDPKAPAPGSFRAVLAQAQPGDVIVFGQALVIPLAGDVTIAKEGLTVRGPGGFQRAATLTPAAKLPKISVRANGVTLEGLDLRDLVVAALPASSKGVLEGFAARSLTVQGRSQLALQRCLGAVLDHCTIHVDHRNPKGVSLLPAIRDLSSVGTQVTHCDVANPNGLALAASLVTGAVVTDCTFDGDVDVFAGRAKKGFVPTGSVQAGDLTFDRNVATDHEVEIKPAGIHFGPIRVRNNTAGRMIAFGGMAQIRENVLGLTPTHPLFRTGTALAISNSNRDGPMMVERNRTTGAYVGLSLFCVSANALCMAEGNIVDDADNIGISIHVSDTAIIHGNIVKNGLRLGVKTAMALSGNSPSMRVEDNIIHDTQGEGIRVLNEKPGTKLKNNEIRDNAGSGIWVQDGATAEIEIGVVERNATGLGPDVTFGGGAGIVFFHSRPSSVKGTIVRDNGGSGIYVESGSVARISRVSCTRNAGLGIDAAPDGVTPTGSKGRTGRVAPPTALEFDGTARTVKGTAEPGALVEVYLVEPGPRTGNPENGEGFEWKAEGTAGSDGKFAIPVVCANDDVLTLTATRLGKAPMTSEFSRDVVCSGEPIVMVSMSAAGGPGTGRSGLFVGQGVRNRGISEDGRYVAFTSAATDLVGGDTNGLIDVFLRDVTAGTTTRISRTLAGGQVEQAPGVTFAAGWGPSISGDGRFVVYESNVETITGQQSFNYESVVLFDTQLGATTIVANSIGMQTPYPSGEFTLYGGIDAVISGDGSTVAFASIGADYVLGDAGVDMDVFVWTRASGAYERVSVPTGGGDVTNGTSPGSAGIPRMSHDGRFVVFSSLQNLTGGNVPAGVKLYLRDRQNATTEAVSLDEAGAVKNGGDGWVSDDGRYVVFETSTSLVASDTNGKRDVYVRDRQAGTTTRVSKKADGSQFTDDSYAPTMSGDGRFVGFQTKGQYEVPDELTVTNISEVWLADLVAGTTAEAAVGASGEAQGDAIDAELSRNGRYLSFESTATNLVTLPGQVYEWQMFLRTLPAPAN
jgi:Tol biopolymer transport system component